MARRSAPMPIWSNILLRTALYYAALAALLYWANKAHVTVGGLGLSDSDTLQVVGLGKKALAKEMAPQSGPAALPTAIAMVSALLVALPVSWIYTLTHRKKGWKQSTLQSLVVLPVVIAGIVVLLKYSLPLAFGIAAVVAAVRFKSTLSDTKDSAYMLCGIGLGLSAGVNPEIAGVLSFIFSTVVVGMWYTDFGRAPAALEGRLAEATLERALEHASRTGTFVARMDDEVFKSLAPDQLEAIADRAWRRRKRNAPDLADDDHAATHEEYSALLRIRTASPDKLRDAIEVEFPNLFKRWRFGDVLHEPDGLHTVEYAVELGSTVTPGVVSDTLRAVASHLLVRLELR
jgi:hypothetical protein